MTKEEKKQLKTLQTMLFQAWDVMTNTDALQTDKDGGYVHNAMVLSEIITHIKHQIDESAQNERLKVEWW